MNLCSPSPDVDVVSDSPYTSSNIRTDGQPKVGRGLPSIDNMRTLEERRRQADKNMERIDALLTRELACSVKSGDVCSSVVQALALAKIALEMSSENLRKEEK